MERRSLSQCAASSSRDSRNDGWCRRCVGIGNGSSPALSPSSSLVLIFVLIFVLLPLGAQGAHESQPTDKDLLCYAQHYPDLQEAMGTDVKALRKHWVHNGKVEGRHVWCASVPATIDKHRDHEDRTGNHASSSSSLPMDMDSQRDCSNRLYRNMKANFERLGYTYYTSCSLRHHKQLLPALARYTRHLLGPLSDVPRIQDGWTRHSSVADAAADVNTNRFLAYLHDGRRVTPFQTLNFARGTGQRTHSDVVHFDTLPKRGLMVAAWLALEDIHPASGPLVFYPGSHRTGLWDFPQLGLPNGNLSTAIPMYARYEQRLQSVIETLGLKAKLASDIPAGDTFVWAASLLHGGSEVQDPNRTRLSQVTHYWVEGANQYWTPRMSGSELFLKDERSWRPLANVAERAETRAGKSSDARADKPQARE